MKWENTGRAGTSFKLSLFAARRMGSRSSPLQMSCNNVDGTISQGLRTSGLENDLKAMFNRLSGRFVGDESAVIDYRRGEVGVPKKLFPICSNYRGCVQSLGSAELNPDRYWEKLVQLKLLQALAHSRLHLHYPKFMWKRFSLVISAWKLEPGLIPSKVLLIATFLKRKVVSLSTFCANKHFSISFRVPSKKCFAVQV